jgi:predicted HicB family RNase H-like nuclease
MEEKKTKKEPRKLLSLRLTKEMWKFLRIEAFQKEISTNQLIENILLKYKKRIENKLTGDDDVIP